MVAAVGAEVTQADAMILGAGFAAEARATQLDAGDGNAGGNFAA
jgi:hypothetical protein